MAKHGGFPGMGMGGNMQQLARQAQKLQQQMTEKQAELGWVWRWWSELPLCTEGN